MLRVRGFGAEDLGGARLGKTMELSFNNDYFGCRFRVGSVLNFRGLGFRYEGTGDRGLFKL